MAIHGRYVQGRSAQPCGFAVYRHLPFSNQVLKHRQVSTLGSQIVGHIPIHIPCLDISMRLRHQPRHRLQMVIPGRYVQGRSAVFCRFCLYGHRRLCNHVCSKYPGPSGDFT